MRVKTIFCMTKTNLACLQTLKYLFSHGILNTHAINLDLKKVNFINSTRWLFTDGFQLFKKMFIDKNKNWPCIFMYLSLMPISSANLGTMFYLVPQISSINSTRWRFTDASVNLQSINLHVMAHILTNLFILKLKTLRYTRMLTLFKFFINLKSHV